MNLTLAGGFTLLAPLSHIGGTASNRATFVRHAVLQPDGTIERLPAYAGNAWRGQLRDCAGIYLCERLGLTLSLQAFHLLLGGGAIGGEQQTDLGALRTLRDLVPLLAVWGGGAGNMILAGKLRIGVAYPVCREAIPLLPAELHEQAARVSYRKLLIDVQYTRHDDSRDDRLIRYLAPPEEQRQLPGMARATADAERLHRPERPQQMIYEAQMLAPGTQLWHTLRLRDVSEVEAGAFVSALDRFQADPCIGGKVGSGHGLVRLDYASVDREEGVQTPFVHVDPAASVLSHQALQLKSAYDDYLARYDAHLGEHRAAIAAFLGSPEAAPDETV